MCDSNMKPKIRSLFISIALSFLLGCIVQANILIPEEAETNFGTLAETVSFHDYILDLEEPTVSNHDIASEINDGKALRHFPQAKRVNNPSSSKDGLAFVKRNHIIYSSPLIIESSRRFPSGLTEARQYLISLGKLII